MIKSWNMFWNMTTTNTQFWDRNDVVLLLSAEGSQLWDCTLLTYLRVGKATLDPGPREDAVHEGGIKVVV